MTIHKRNRALVFMVTLVWGFAFLPVMAQQQPDPENGKPQSILFPADRPGPYIPPPPESLAKDTEDTAPPSVDAVQDIPLTVETVELIEIPDAAKGLLQENTGGLPVSFWQGSARPWIMPLLSALPTARKSPTLAALTDRLLLSAVAVPDSVLNSGPDFRPNSDQNSDQNSGQNSGQNPDLDFGNSVPDSDDLKPFLALRIRKIAESGNLKNLAGFLNLMAPSALETSPETSDFLLMTGQISAACLLARQALDSDQTTAYWLKLLAYCQAVEGNGNRAALTLDLLIEQGNRDFVFHDLVHKLVTAQKETEAGPTSPFSISLDQLDPMIYSLLSLLEQPIDVANIDQADQNLTHRPLVLYALSSNALLSQEQRLMAGGAAFRRATLPLDKMRGLYDTVAFTPEEYENAIAIASVDDSIMGDALLYQSAARQIDPQARAAALKTISERALPDQDMPRSALLNARTLGSLAPSEDLLFYAHDITRGLLLSGQYGKGQDWYRFVQTRAFGGDEGATRALVDIWPLMLIVKTALPGHQDDVPWSQDILDLWWQGQMTLPVHQRQNKAALFFALAEALGYRVPDVMWQRLIAAPNVGEVRAAARAMSPHTIPMAIPLAIWRALIQAGNAGKQGETLLLCLLAGVEGGISRLDPAGAGAVILALGGSGFPDEARKLALEIMANNGF